MASKQGQSSEAGVATAHFDEAFDLVAASTGFCKLFDLDPQAVKQRPHVADLLGLSRQKLGGYEGGTRKVRTSTQGVNLKLLRGRSSGTMDTEVGGRVVRTEIHPLDDGTIVTRHRDITDSGSSVLASRQEREDEARRLRRLLETSPTGVLIAREKDGKVLFFNSRLADMIGIGEPQAFFQAYGDSWLFQDRAFLIEDLHRNGRLRDFELQLTAADGSQLWFLTWVESLTFEDERAILYWCHDITRLKESEAKLAEQALYDALTGLPNRTLLEETLRHNMASNKRQGRVGAVLFLDLDGFKAVNDSYGHEAGDEVLCATARRLASHLRSADMPARLAGDEFVAILHDLSQPHDAGLVAQKIVDAVNEPVPWEGNELRVTPSIGVCNFDGTESGPAELIGAADEAMYAAKEGGKATYAFAKAPDRFAPGTRAAE